MHQQIKIGDWILDTGRQQLRRGPETRDLPDLSYRTLMVLVESAPEIVSYDELIDRVWSGRHTSTETVSKRIQLLRDVLDDHAVPHRYIAVVRNRGYRFLLRPQPAESASAPKALQTPGIRYAMLAAVIMIALLGVLFIVSPPGLQAPGPGANETGAELSVGVMPFQLIGDGAGESRTLAHGLHEDLLTRISKLEALHVVSATTSRNIDPSDGGIRSVARELGARYILEGALQTSPDRVRINLQLIDAESDRHIWAETYDRQYSADAIFAIQSEIVEQVAAALSQSISPRASEQIAHPPTNSMEAYNAYLAGRARLYERNNDSALEAVRQFQQAVEFDPTFGDAWAMLGEAWLLTGDYADHPDEDFLRYAREAIDRAMILDPESSKAYQVRSLLADFQGDVPAAIRYAQKSIALDSANARAHEILGEYHKRYTGDLELAELMWRRATELNPDSMWANYQYGSIFVRRGNLERALEHLHRAQQLGMNSPPAYDWLRIAYTVAGGDLAEAARWAHRCIENIPGSRDCFSAIISSYANLLDLDAMDMWWTVYKSVLPGPAGQQLEPYLLNGDFEGAVQGFDAMSAYQQFNRDEQAMFRIAAEKLGRPDLVLNYYRRITPTLFETGSEEILPRHLYIAPDIARLERQHGSASNAARIIALTEKLLEDTELVRTLSPYMVRDVRIALDLYHGKLSQAVARLKDTFERGNWHGWWRYDLDPRYEPLWQLNAYQDLMAEIHDSVSAQRDAIRREYPLDLAVTGAADQEVPSGS